VHPRRALLGEGLARSEGANDGPERGFPKRDRRGDGRPESLDRGRWVTRSWKEEVNAEPLQESGHDDRTHGAADGDPLVESRVDKVYGGPSNRDLANYDNGSGVARESGVAALDEALGESLRDGRNQGSSVKQRR